MAHIITKKTWRIGICSDLEVIGYNPENADLDRPNGEIIGEVYYLRATDDFGNRRVYGDYRSKAQAQAALPLAPQVVMWEPSRPEYGSQAYEAYGAAEDMEAEGRLNEMEGWGMDTRFERVYGR